eukprot:2754301-Lingulodinium_polyedra.AAC.1
MGREAPLAPGALRPRHAGGALFIRPICGPEALHTGRSALTAPGRLDGSSAGARRDRRGAP